MCLVSWRGGCAERAAPRTQAVRLRACADVCSRRSTRKPSENRPSRSRVRLQDPVRPAGARELSANSAHHALTAAAGGTDGVHRGSRGAAARRGAGGRRGAVRARAADGASRLDGHRAVLLSRADRRVHRASGAGAGGLARLQDAPRLLAGFDGLERYLASVRIELAPASARARAAAAVRACSTTCSPNRATSSCAPSDCTRRSRASSKRPRAARASSAGRHACTGSSSPRPSWR